MKQVLSQLVGLWGPSGREDEVAGGIRRLLAGAVDEARVDSLGNLLCVRRPRGGGSGRRILLLAHMDVPGGVVTGVTDRGLLRFGLLGDLSLAAVRGQRVRFRSGLPGVLDGERVEEPKDIKLAGSWVDVGAATRDAAMAKVREGDLFVLDGALAGLENRVAGPGLDNRAGCAVLVQAMRAAAASPHEVHLAFTCQSPANGLGATTAAFQVEPDLAVVVDLSPAELGKGADTKLGAGPALRFKDGGWLLRPAARQALEAAAAAAGIEPQREVLGDTTTDAAAVQQVAAGIPVGVVAIPGRYLGTPVEMVDLGDLLAAVAWLVALLRLPLSGTPAS